MRTPHPSKGTPKGHVTFDDVTSGQKADIAQLPVAHAQNILPVGTFSIGATSGLVTDVTSGHVTSGRSPLLPRKSDLNCPDILLPGKITYLL